MIVVFGTLFLLRIGRRGRRGSVFHLVLNKKLGVVMGRGSVLVGLHQARPKLEGNGFQFRIQTQSQPDPTRSIVLAAPGGMSNANGYRAGGKGGIKGVGKKGGRQKNFRTEETETKVTEVYFLFREKVAASAAIRKNSDEMWGGVVEEADRRADPCDRSFE